ncbi:MAG TPA: zinc ribbon domain-containing protein [Solirubrobacterales bacterium]|nr:zinc ribbon domain-containing protein [Solirubrobacterales bacterium]
MTEDSKPGRARAIGAEEIETTGGEKLLAVVLGIFILIGAGWAYDRIDHIDRPAGSQAPQVTREDRAALEKGGDKRAARIVATRRHTQAVEAMELRREAYRTALDAGEPAEELRQRYLDAQAELAAATATLRNAKRAEQDAAPAAAGAQRRIDQTRAAAAQRYDDERRSHDRLVFVLRLAFVLALLAGSYKLLSRLRNRNSRYLPAAFALTFAAALLALGMAAEYAGNYIEFSSVGPLAISLAGIALTLAAFVALQRYLRRRVPLRRVRRGDCPFCGYPVRKGRHCEGCGREVVADCSTCHESRRVGAPRCAACGNA